MFVGILSWVTSVDRCPLCNEAVVSRDEPRLTPVLEDDLGKSHEGENEAGSLPDLMSSALYHLREGMQATDANPGEKQREKRSYSFMLHDHARYVHLVKRG